MKACPEYPDGIIFSAGYDKVVKGYFPNSTNLMFSLTGHTNTGNLLFLINFAHINNNL